ncbi:PREDICTED: calcium-activated potassium channel subunit beta-2 isoform X1 [Galeopterus variegatus]|uniref:Calcium-activated potassium channel subunit beta n=2 Tax=Galeopterus variegatus TaxID=482537 RepID=A0ABM0QS61_GALVR|nr:PREDICTED: calcium-activated potassium channel subunit beta-2 isoform X1 [Galeopterus variegatus]
MATMHQRSFYHSSRTSTIRKEAPGPTPSKMFIWTSGRTSSSYRHDEKSVWTEESQCTLLNASITETFNCSFSCGPDCWKLSQYPCLQVYVNLTSSGEKLLLYHTEETMKINQKCSYIPKCGKNFEESMSLVSVVMENFRKYQHFSCYSDPEGNQKSVILTKLYSSNVLFHSLFWPTCMMAGGVAIVAMVKLTQYLSLLCERIQRINR